MTECIDGCGACCDPVALPYNRIEAMTLPEIPEDQRQWAARSLVAMSTREAFAIAPWLRGKIHRSSRDGGVTFSPTFYFRCLHFDRETRRCTDYDNRPEMCRDFPWYGNDPHPSASLPPTCSFRADLGEVPVAITRKPG